MHSSLTGLRGVLFDFDGTLAPNLDLPDMRRQVIELTQNWGVPDDVFRDQYIVEIIDVARADLLRRGEDGEQYFAAAHKLITDIELNAAAETRVFDFTVPLLQGLLSAEVASAIVTRNCSQAVQQTFPQLQSLNTPLFARDQVRELKPLPGHFSAAIEHMNVAAAQTAIVSDGAMDMRTGRSLGLRCIGVLTGSSDSERLLEAGADVVLDHAGELLTA